MKFPDYQQTIEAMARQRTYDKMARDAMHLRAQIAEYDSHLVKFGIVIKMDHDNKETPYFVTINGETSFFASKYDLYEHIATLTIEQENS